MKTKLICAALLCGLAGLASCSSDEPVNGEQNRLQKGDDSYAAFSIKLKKTATTRAEFDSYTDDVERTISDISIYIFSGGVLEVAATPQMSENENVTVPVAVSTGDKVVYAVTSNMLSLTAEEEVTVLSDFEKQLFDALSETVAQSDNFVMIGKGSANVVKCTESEAQANPMSINVTRASAKLLVTFDGDNVKVAQTMKATVGDCWFTAAQCARQMYVERGNRFTETGKKTNGVGTYPGYTEVVEDYASDWFCQAHEETSPLYGDNRYMGENVVENPTSGKVTFALIRTKVTPTGKLWGNKNLPSDGTFWVVARNIAKTATWIFSTDENYSMIYFATETDAKKYIADSKLGTEFKAYKYTKGQAYYRVNLINTDDENATPSEVFRVMRNNYYRLSVTDIKNLGAPYAPGVVPSDPDTPLDQDSFLACEIEIEPWTVHDNDSQLQ